MSRTLRLAAGLFAAITSAAALRAASSIAIPLQIEPPQPVRAVALRAGETVQACEVRNGMLLVPADLPLPWTTAQNRFEQTSYTREDLKRRAPLVLRELGQIRLRLRPSPAATEPVRAHVLRNGDATPSDVVLARDARGFRAALPSGTYASAFTGDGRATRIRSGIVVAPGQTTELGELSFEPSGSVLLRVVDATSNEPVAGADVTWTPPGALNADVARALYARLWSSTTDRAGFVTFRSIGPPPIPVQWTVQAQGYAPTLTRRAFVADTRKLVLPDTPLRRESIVVIDVALPKPSEEFRGASLVLSEPESDDSPRYRALSRQPLLDGENRVKLLRFGRRRISIEDSRGRALFYRDLDLQPDDLHLTFAPLPTTISGVVRGDDQPLEGAIVTAADWRDHRAIHARATTDHRGRYTFTTYQSGRVLIYANAPRDAEGTSPGTVTSAIVLRGEPERTVDLEFPDGEAVITVVDAQTGLPVRAVIHGQLTRADGSGSQAVRVETDSEGRGTIRRVPQGTAGVVVRARGYRTREVDIEIREGTPVENTIALSRAGKITGVVTDRSGAPIANAQVSGGFSSPLAHNPRFETATDAAGRFEILEGPEPGTMFYAAAPGYALGAAVLRENAENRIVLSPPNSGALALVAGNAPPRKLELVMAGPRGGEIVPFEVFRAVASFNGMSPFQFLGSGADGTLVFPEFLPAGTWTLYVVRPGKPGLERYHRVADVVIPAKPGTVVTIPE